MTNHSARTIRWGDEPELFGPRHEYRESVLLDAIVSWKPEDGAVLDAAAGLGTLSRKLARRGFQVVSLDRSWESLLHHRRLARAEGIGSRSWTVLGDMNQMPFRSGALAGAVSAETMEHLDDDRSAAIELARAIAPGGGLAVSTPADPGQWSDWDVWAEHRRRYRKEELTALFSAAGFSEMNCRSFGFPIVRLYDALFLRRMIRQRASSHAKGKEGRLVSFARQAGRSRLAVQAVIAIFQIDRLFEKLPRGVGWTLTAARSRSGAR